MATINYKEKYEKAVHAAMLAKQDTESDVTIRILEEIFPELKESEDERIRKDIIATIHLYYGEPLEDEAKEMIAWLEKQEIKPFKAEHGKCYYCIKDYFCGGKKQASKGDVVQALRGLPIMGLKDASEYFLPVNFIKCNSAWSEEDESRMDNLCHFLEEYGNQYYGHLTLQGTISWLKSLKPQPKQEWSEEDKTIIDSLLDVLYRIKKGKDPQATTRLIEQHINFIKSLKERYAWKPSEEQINALAKNVEYVNVGCTQPILKELLEDLKKLKG